MRVAVADIGTNSCHLLIAEAQGSSYRILDSLKERTRLGECLEDGRLTLEGERRLCEALSQFQVRAQSEGVSDVRAYATSAMRQASNGPEVAARVQLQTGIYPAIISGEREGQLTYLGAAHSVEFGADNLLLDLGGGSLELARGGPQRADKVVSLPLGSVTMHLSHLKKEPPQARAIKALQEAVRRAIEPYRDSFGVRSHTQVFGSSGTFEAVGVAIAQRQGQTHVHEGNLGGFSFEVTALSALLAELQKLTVAQRIRAGIDPRRADIIVAGVAILDAALRALGAERASVSTGALREGMLVEELDLQARWREGLSARQRSAAELAERFQVSVPHARQVTALSRDLLERLRRRGETFDPNALSFISAAAFLHEIGQAVSQSSHHKHSAYLIRHAGLRGFDARQTELVAQIARYHRKGLPRGQHPEFQALSPDDRYTVRQLAAILRVADGLDRSHAGQTKVADLRRKDAGWVLSVRGATQLDAAGFHEKRDLWQQVYGPIALEEVDEAQRW